MNVKNGSPNCNTKSTPPTKERVRNPFDKVLIERLHKPICSPGMCKIYKKQKNGTFRWDIDQACTLLPADIVACSSQFEPSPDPVLEKIAEEANEKFFSQEMVVPSPLEVSKKIKPLLSSSTESSSSLIITSLVSEKTVEVRDFSAQTVLSLPPELPPEIETILQQYCTFTQEQNISGDYEITANGSLRRQLVFEEHSDMEHDDSEQTDDEIHIEQRPPSRFEAHTPVAFSPDLNCGVVTKGMKRTFGTPLHKGRRAGNPCYRNKILDVVDFGEPCFSPIEFRTPKRNQTSATSSSLTSASISPVAKTVSSDEEKNNFTSPESEAMATCLDCAVSSSATKAEAACFCNIAPSKSIVKRSASLKDSPHRSRKGSLSEKRSLSMSSLNRSRSVQKLDFSMDMSIDGSQHNVSQADSESSPKAKQVAWSIEEVVKTKSEIAQSHKIQSSTQNFSVNTLLDETPIKGKHKKNVLSHEISKIRAPMGSSPGHMSLDSSLDNLDMPLVMEEKKIDFNNIDLKLLTENVSQFEYNSNATRAGESSTSFKRVDSGFNENTFYASSYYESAIKPSELTVTNSKIKTTALKEISNINWMRVDSGFKDETSDSMQFYCNDSSTKREFRFSQAKLPDKENIEEFENFLIQTPSNNEAISMSDIFTDDMTFNCNFSSTPSKNKSRKVNN
ncbi:protein aurora borealis [Maniola jurtina]|uniref:protein aurora borealis n=1 Tax=Maniola jurtina TaxID=191418 RepID=UPI001E687294|nr:protein aurora borealis [Maniola jurtina]